MPDTSSPYTSGPLDAPLVLVGEAPGESEEQHGGAFIGAAGKLLTDLLASAGINRMTCRIDNLFQFRPPKNDITPFLNLSKKPPRESPEYLKARAELLDRLRQTSATTIVALGGAAAYALTGRTNIVKQRGSVLVPPDLGDRKVLLSIHPSAALREYLFRRLIVLDLQRALENSRTSGLLYPERQLILDPSFTEAQDFLAHCSRHASVAYDIETRGHHLSHISFATSPTEAICIPFVDGASDVWNPDEEYCLLLAIGQLLENPAVTKVGQNLTFDSGFMYSNYGFHVWPLEDTMIAQGILLPDYPKGLDFLTSLYCGGEPYYKDDGKEWFRNPFSNETTFRRYSAMDSAVIQDIWPAQQDDLRRCGNWQTYIRQRNLIQPLVFASHHGIRLDTERLQLQASNAQAYIQKLEEELLELTEEPLNINSPQQVQTYFYIKKRLRPHTKQGQITSDDKALKQIAAKGFREAEIILELRHQSKMLSTYYGVKLDPDQRLRCSFNPVGTKQGRISSSKTIRGTGMNFQNQPKDMDNVMLADPGYLVVNQDLGQAENRVVAYVAGEHRMITAFDQGVDIHKQTAALIFEVPVEAVTDEQRQTGKKSNHCKLRTCEVLTPYGWMSIQAACEGEYPIAQWATTNEITYTIPTAWHQSTYTGPIYTYIGRDVFQEMTPEHRIPAIRRQSSKAGSVRDFTAEKLELTSSWEWPLAGVKTDGQLNIPPIIIRLLTAFQADGTWVGGNPRWRLKNKSKIKRLLAILSLLETSYTQHTYGEYTAILIRANTMERELLREYFPHNKLWPTSFLELSMDSMQTLADELPRWDGDGSAYWTTLQPNADFAQTVFHLAGYKSNIGWACKSTGTYRVSRIDKFSTRMDTLKLETREVTDEPIFCPTVETGYFLVREGGKISITGNSLNYGQGVNGFANQWLLPHAQAQFIWSRYHEVYPGIHDWHTGIRDTLARQNRTLVNCFGRHRTFLDRWGAEMFKVAYSYVPQSTVAEQMNQRGVLYLYTRQDLFEPVIFLNTIHDSIRYQVPLSLGIPQILSIIRAVKDSLETPITWRERSFSIPVDTELGFSFDKSRMLKWKAQYFTDSWESLPEELSRYVSENR